MGMIMTMAVRITDLVLIDLRRRKTAEIVS